MFHYKIFIWSIIYGLIILEGNQAKIIKKRGVMDNVNDGLKVAGQMFGINTAADVANLVAKAFSKTNSNENKPDLFSLIQKGLQLSTTHSISSEDSKSTASLNTQEHSQQQQQQQPIGVTKSASDLPSKEVLGLNFDNSNLIASMLRMVGFDVTKLGALAINALIMIATAISNTIMGNIKLQPVGGHLFNRHPAPTHTSGEYVDTSETGPEEKYAPNDHQPRMLNDSTTINWFLKNPSSKMKRILKEATHTNLADKLTEMITNYETEQGEGSCLKMLICKSSPFIWGMQKSIRKYTEPQEETEEESIKENKNEENLAEERRFFNMDHFFTHLPTIEEYRQNGEKCEQLYAIHCNTTDLYVK